VVVWNFHLRKVHAKCPACRLASKGRTRTWGTRHDTISSVSDAFPVLEELAVAIDNYSYPCFVYDFSKNQEINLGSMAAVERFIGDRLLSTDIERVRDGLSNVLFWGNYNSGYRTYRVDKFRAAVDSQTLRQAVDVFASLQGCAISDMKRLKLPGFGCLSFLSKLRTFLDLSAFCVIDLKLRRDIPALKEKFKAYGPKPTSIPVTQFNEESYGWWVGLCRKTALQMAGEVVRRPVDVERGFFQMVNTKKADNADSLIRQLDQKFISHASAF